MDYYKKKIVILEVDKNDKPLGKVERWLAHKQGILHRGFTVVLISNKQLILQHRRHPAFDGLYDLSFSSHPVYINNKLQSMEEAIYQTLTREWNLKKEDLKTGLKFIDKFYYQARDPKSIYTEHEIDYIYAGELNKLPKPNPDFAYGYKIINQQPVSSFEFRVSDLILCPWVKQIIANKSFQELLSP